MQTNHKLTKQEVLNYIESLRLSPEQMKIVKAMNILIEIHAENNMKKMEKRFDDLEVSLREYFEKMTGDYRSSIDDEINKFMGEWYRRNVVSDKFRVSMEILTAKLSSY